MFGRSIDKSIGLLFVTYDLGANLRNAIAHAQKEVADIDINRFLNTAPEDLKQYLVEKYSVVPITLLRDDWYVEQKEMQIDVRHDPRRYVTDSSRPLLVPGERVEVRVPFAGARELFYSASDRSDSNPPRILIEGNELVLRYDSPEDQPQDVRALADQAIGDIERYLGWQRPMIDAHNTSLPHVVEQAIQQRRARLHQQAQRVGSLGIPVKRRDSAPQTYAVPTVRRKAIPVLPPATTAQFQPEPVWAMEHYEDALKIMQNMAVVMERSPGAFKSMDEEALRQHFLVQLNGQFEGNATGETFNMSGKTDILLREGDRNVFIAECKIWKGPKAFGEAIDQLLGYATWRDSKTAILVFNRGTDTSTVLSGIDSTTKLHNNFKRTLSWPHESGFRYVFHSKEDKNRELIMTVLVFLVPK